jgi:hypothetical protein
MMQHEMTRISIRLALLGALLAASPALALEPATGTGITVDGQIGDWNTTADYLAPMYRTGNPTRSVLSHVHMRYDCAAGMLYILVLDNPGDGLLPLASTGDAWVKFYGLGWSGNKLIDGNGDGNTTPRQFEWVWNGPELYGYEACAAVAPGVYDPIEVHLEVGGETSSTGKYVHGHAIPLTIACDATAGTGDRPATLALESNWPNPFNPVTTIGFTLPETALARLSVYNLAGTRVATLVDGLTGAGFHQASFDASNLASGVYFYTLEAAGLHETRKMILQK